MGWLCYWFLLERGSGLAAHRHRVDVGDVSREGLSAHAVPDVPQLGGGVAGPRHEGLVVGTQGQTHDVPRVAGEGGGLLARLDVPQRTSKKKKNPKS